MSEKERKRMYNKEELQMLEEIKALKARGFRGLKNQLDIGDDVSISPPKEGYDYAQLEEEFE